MPPLLRYLFRRIVAIPVTLLVITAVLYAFVMLTPPETRALLYLPERMNPNLSDERYQNLVNQIIKRHHLNDPFPIQYIFWLRSLLTGQWGYSPSLNQPVLAAILQRTPATLELTLYSLLLFIPLGMLSGTLAAQKRNQATDLGFRLLAFIATSLPSFILSFVLMAVFYVSLRWFAPERITTGLQFNLVDTGFHFYTGLLTIDGVLNGRFDVVVDALRHLVMPVFTLILYHWATLGRITRASILVELARPYVIAARARGLAQSRVVWRHALRNVLAPALTSTAFSASSLLGGVFVVEIIFRFNGVSYLIVQALSGIPDAPAALGFAIYSVLVVLLLMLALDLVQAVVDPRVRDEVLET